MNQSVVGAQLSPSILPEEFEAWQEVFPLGKECIWYPRNQLFDINNKVNGFHFVVEGLFRSSAYSIEGQQRTLWIMGRNVLMGEVSMLSGAPSIYSVECEGKGRTIFFSREIFHKTLIKGYPLVVASIMRILSLKVRMQSEDSLAWNFLPAWKRVGEFFLKSGSDPQKPIPLRHKEIADFLGIHRVTVSKAISKLCKDGFICHTSDGLYITNPQLLMDAIRIQ